MANLDKLTNVSEVNQLILLGKEKGYLTYEEVNDVLPSNLVTPDQIDDLMNLFGENKINIVDSVSKGEKLNTDKAKGKRNPGEGEGAPASKSDSVS